jgi:hypothetical protein
MPTKAECIKQGGIWVRAHYRYIKTEFAGYAFERSVHVRGYCRQSPIKKEHDKLVSEEKSPRIQYIENFYVDKFRALGQDLDLIKAKIEQIGSFSEEEMEHVKRHITKRTNSR